MKTVKERVETAFTEKRSEFVSVLCPIKSEDEAKAVLEEIRTAHRHASHNCYAYIVGENTDILRFDDDGEPSQTAGLPILEVLRKNDLTNVLCVVTRYYGGIKLGAGGLVRAYKRGASSCVEKAKIQEIKTMIRYRIALDFVRGGRIEDFLQGSARIVSRDYTEAGVFFLVEIEEKKAEAFLRELRDKTKGAAEATPVDTP